MHLHICQYCNKPIWRNGKELKMKKGRGYEKEGKKYHSHCLKKVIKKIK